MRFLRLSLVMMAVAVPAAAQDGGDRCAQTPGGSVEVETTAQGTLVGTLYCLGASEVSILRQGQQMVVPLSQVTRIRKPADPVWDGAVKGAAVVLTMWGVTCKFCGEARPYMWRAALGWSLLGVTIDALQTNRKTIYVSNSKVSVGWRVGF